MARKNVSVLLVGISGFGGSYLNPLLHAQDGKDCTLAGVVDVQPERSPFYSELLERGIPVHSSMESFYASSGADLAIISTPIQFHTEQTCYALERGSHVLCEKPIAATIQDALKMQEARDRSGKFVAIGFNMPYEDHIQQLKNDIMSGIFGKPIRLKTIVLWSRSEQYYRRTSGWAGRKMSGSGQWILDSVAHNATSHYLHNMLYLIGDRPDRSADLHSLEAELYRANEIENFDTCASRIRTKDGVELLFYAAHPVLKDIGPRYCFECEKATITYDHDSDSDTIRAVFHDGTEKSYSGEVNNDHKLWRCIEWAREDRLDMLCGIEAAMTEVVCVNAMQESVPDISGFPSELVRREEESSTVWVEGLYEALLQCYDRSELPSEAGTAWGRMGKTVDLRNYRFYNG